MEPTMCRAGALPILVWDLAESPRYVVSSAPVGGGIGVRAAVVNAQVAPGYGRVDVAVHVAELAAGAGIARATTADDGDLVGMITAADVTDVQRADDGGVVAWSTVGIAVPTWASAPDGDRSPAPVAGTINIVAELPVRLTDAALVNAVATVAEAKAQALLEAGVAGTGTATDAVCLLCPAHEPAAAAGAPPHDPFGGPRSTWGARLARAVHATIAAGIPRSIARYS